jgi:DUF177 domain-containing protein
MAAQYHNIDLGRLALTSGEGRRLEIEVEPGDLELGGERYGTVPARIPARLDVSRSASGHAFRLAFDAAVAGPCMRCLADARAPVPIEAREVDLPGSGDEELASPYVDGEVLDVDAWAHDALVLALPAQILCRPDCAGLCAVCGASLNDADPADHDHDRGADPRSAQLGELLE